MTTQRLQEILQGDKQLALKEIKQIIEEVYGK